MSVAALASGSIEGPLLQRHADFVAGLDCNDQAKRLRRRGAERFLARHRDLDQWMRRPTADRIAEARRLYAWPFLSWCFAVGELRPDVEVLLAKGKGAHFLTWARMHPDQATRVADTARSMGWVDEWVYRVSTTALATVCMVRQTSLDRISLDDLAAVRAGVEASVAVLPRGRASQRGLLHSLHTVCYQLGLVDVPPEHANARHTTMEQRMAPVPQPIIRDAFARYLRTVSTTLRPKTVESRASCLTLFGVWLGQHHREITVLRQLRRHHLEEFLAYDAGRACQGKAAGQGRTISITHHARAVRELRAFFDDITIWGWADRPPSLVLHRGDIPRLPAPLPRAPPPHVDATFMAAVHQIKDPAARAELVLLRGTGLRLGELLDLELDCLCDVPGHGTWLKVPLGKLNTERVVPLDADTLTALDEWITACPDANICENFDNYQTSSEFLPQLHDQLTDTQALHDDAVERGWDSEVTRHARLIASLQRHIDRLKHDTL